MSEERPNLLIVMTDQQKATAIGLYGNLDVRTPALESLAGRGLLYRYAFTPHPLCVPARVSLWTGRYPHQHGSRTNEILMPEGEHHAARVLRDAGYSLALIGKNHCFRPADLQLFDHVYLAGHTGPQGKDDDPGVAEARDFFRRHDFRGRWSAHPIDYPRERCAAWLIAERVRALFAAQAARQRLFYRLSRFREATERDIRRALAMYYAQIAFADDCLGRVLQTLDETNLRARTIVAFTSDHGDYSGEHRMMTKSGALYDCLTRVPLVVSYPGRLPEGEVREELVSTLDLVPTMLALAGVDAPPALTPDVFQARGLPGTGVGSGEPREAVFAEYAAGGPPLPELLPEPDPSAVPPVGGGPAQGGRGARALPVLRAREGEGRPKMVRTHRWKYVYDSDDPVDELYDLEHDPWELENLAAQPEHAQIVNEMRRRLLDWSLRTEDPRPVPLMYDPATFEPSHEASYWPPASRSVPSGDACAGRL